MVHIESCKRLIETIVSLMYLSFKLQVSITIEIFGIIFKTEQNSSFQQIIEFV